MGRGYERTTMADIVAGLGGLTKGAVYHHFKSKEDIFEAVFERASRPVVARDRCGGGGRSAARPSPGPGIRWIHYHQIS